MCKKKKHIMYDGRKPEWLCTIIALLGDLCLAAMRIPTVFQSAPSVIRPFLFGGLQQFLKRTKGSPLDLSKLLHYTGWRSGRVGIPKVCQNGDSIWSIDLSQLACCKILVGQRTANCSCWNVDSQSYPHFGIFLQTAIHRLFVGSIPYPGL